MSFLTTFSIIWLFFNQIIVNNPITQITSSEKNIYFKSYIEIKDPKNKLKSLIYNKDQIPNWAFYTRRNNKLLLESYHRDLHGNIFCNQFQGNRVLFHLIIPNFFKIDLFLLAYYTVEEIKDGYHLIIRIEPNYDQPGIDKIKHFFIELYILRKQNSIDEYKVYLIGNSTIYMNPRTFDILGGFREHIDNFMLNIQMELNK